jgi:DTW domain-containing protein YfiP
VDNRTGIWLLQHKRERHHPIGTARIAELGLMRCRLDVCYEIEPEPPAPVPPKTGVLYPGRDAVALSELPDEERPSTLVVLDGTWHHARVMYRDAAWLHRLPRYALAPKRASRYRIRKEPAADCISTIEAVVEALEILEPETEGLADLLLVFETMIDRQVRMAEAGRGEARRHQRGRDNDRVPRAITGPLDRIVVVYGESAAASSAREGNGRQLVQWTAFRPATAERFDRLVRPAKGWGEGPSEEHLGHMGLTRDQLREADGIDEVAGAFAAYARPDDVLVAWNKSTLDLLPMVAPGRDALPLKASYSALCEGRCGMIEEVLAREGLGATPVAVRGRASQRLGNAAAVLGWLRRRALAAAA